MTGITGSGVEVVAVETPALGDRSYLAHDGSAAVVVDPQRDIDRVLSLAGGLGVEIRDVFETHLHNDYVTGGLALARATGARYHVNGADAVAFDRAAVGDGDVIEVSPLMKVQVLATPGHTYTHLAYVVSAADRPAGIFTGGSLLYGSTGRPDLLGAAHAGELARAQYASAHRLAAILPDDTAVYPTHGFGSFCAATQSEGGFSTIGRERRVNPALTDDEATYVARLLAGLDAHPAYYAHMAPANAAGPGLPDLTPPRRASSTELRRAIEAGEWVVDLRARTAFAAGHVSGTLNFALADGIATYLGWLIPWGMPLTLLGESSEQVAGAQREVARIGIDQLKAATGQPQEWAGGQPLRSYPVARFADLETARRDHLVVVLDVRLASEWAESHVQGAVHVPLHELAARMDEVPDGNVWVYCGSGHRAAIAASLLDAAGVTVTAVDDYYAQAAAAGLPLAAPATSGRAA